MDRAQSEHLVHGDPNSLTGPASFGTSGYIAATQTLPYTIAFANEPTADIPAQQVVVTDPLDPNLDWTTFQVGDFSIGGTIYNVPANDGFYSKRLDLTSTLGIYLDVSAGINLKTGVATWTFTSVDPTTGDLPSDIFTGFLPPDANPPAGEAFVDYTIRPKASDTTGTIISAQASVVFDTNPAKSTKPVVTNTVDSGPPTSSVNPLPAYSPPTFTLNWAGQDDPGGSGVGGYTVFVSDNGGAYSPLVTNTSATSATFTGQDGHTYSFYSIATDNVGNVQTAPGTAQTTTVSGATSFTNLNAPFIKYGTGSTTISGQLQAIGGQHAVPAGETVRVTLDGVTQNATLQSDDSFSTSFTTNVLGMAGSPYTISFGYGGDANFVPVSATSELAVDAATLTITPDGGQSMRYGSTVPVLTYTVSGLVNGDSTSLVSGLLGTTADSATPVGGYAFTLGALAAGANYTLALSAGPPIFVVIPATLTITPTAGQSMTYGATVPVLTYTPTGFMNGETASLLTGLLGTTAMSASKVGTYSFTLGTLAAGANYTLSLSASSPTFSVTPATLSITPTAGQSMPYGSAVPVLTYTPSGFVNGDSASLLTGLLGTTATSASPLGTYAFTLGTLAAGANYTLALPKSPPTFAVTSGPAGAITTDRPTFAWAAVAGADHYSIKVSEGKKVVLTLKGISATTYTLPSAQALSPGQSYSWSVTPVNAKGKAMGPSSSPLTFTIAALTAPTGLVFTSASDTFSWQAVPDAGHYSLKVVNSSGHVVIDIRLAGTTYTLTSKQAKELKPGHSYTWYVKAISTNGKVSMRSTGAEFIFGGGQDTAHAGSGGDSLISGTTTYDGNLARRQELATQPPRLARPHGRMAKRRPLRNPRAGPVRRPERRAERGIPASCRDGSAVGRRVQALRRRRPGLVLAQAKRQAERQHRRRGDNDGVARMGTAGCPLIGLDSAGGRIDNDGMKTIPGRVRNGVVVLQGGTRLPEGAAVTVVPRQSPVIRVAKRRVVRSSVAVVGISIPRHGSIGSLKLIRRSQMSSCHTRHVIRAVLSRMAWQRSRNRACQGPRALAVLRWLAGENCWTRSCTKRRTTASGRERSAEARGLSIR